MLDHDAFLCLFFVFKYVENISGWSWTCSVAKNDLDLLIFLLPPQSRRTLSIHHYIQLSKKKTVFQRDLREGSYRSWSPMGFILKGEGQTEVEAVFRISGVHWPWGSTTTFSTFGAWSGWTMLWAALASDCACWSAMGDRWISWFFSLSCRKESWSLSFNL